MENEKQHTAKDVADLKRQVKTLRSELRKVKEREKVCQTRLNELIPQESMLNNLLNSIPDAIYFKDLKSRFIKISKYLAVKHGLGNEPGRAVGLTDFDIFSGEHARQAYDDEQHVIKTGMPIEEKEELETWHDGRVTWASTHKAPLYDETGKIIGTMGISRDITIRKQMEAELQRLAQLDGLTGIANRRVFDETLVREWRRAKRERSAISFLMIDIDNFKAYNDCYGHLAGDDCLKRVAGVLKRRLARPGDSVARYGGEEFAAILTNTEPEGAVAAAEDIRKKIAELHIIHDASMVANHITVSIGIAGAVPNENFSPNTLLLAADKALYDAKQAGRNRVYVADL